MKIIKILTIYFLLSNFALADKMTWKYGGDWTKTTVIQNGDFMSMAGSFVGTNVMKVGDKEMRTNFVCTGLYQTKPAAMLMGSCNMKLAGTNEFWILNWNCTTSGTGEEKCKGNAAGGTGRFEGVTGSMEWIDIAGFGEGKGTFNLKN